MRRKNETMCEELKLLGARVRDRRLRAGLSQIQFAAAVGISNKQMFNVENGNNWPSLPVYVRICRVLKTRIPKFFEPLAP